MCRIGMEGSVFGGKATVITGFLLFKYSKTSLIEYSGVSVDYKIKKIKNIYKWFFSYIFKVEENGRRKSEFTKYKIAELRTSHN